MTGMWYIAIGTAADWMISGILENMGGIIASGFMIMGVWKLMKSEARFRKALPWVVMLFILALGPIICERQIPFYERAALIYPAVFSSLSALVWFGLYTCLRKVLSEKADQEQVEIDNEKMIGVGKTYVSVAVCNALVTALASYQVINEEWFHGIGDELGMLAVGFGIAVMVTRVLCVIDLIMAWAVFLHPDGLKVTGRGLIKGAVIVMVLAVIMSYGLAGSQVKEAQLRSTFDQVHAVSISLCDEEGISSWDTPEKWSSGTWNLWQEYRDLPMDVNIDGDYQEFRTLLISLERLDWNDPRREEIAETISEFRWGYDTFKPGIWLIEFDGKENSENPEKLIEIVDYLESLTAGYDQMVQEMYGN